MTPSMPRLAVVILNFRNPVDTLACLASVQAAYGTNVQVSIVVVDNASGDGSFQRFVEAGAAAGASATAGPTLPRVRSSVQFGRLLLVESEQNGGFAYGNNIGMLAAQALCDPDFYWLLNNDTAIAAGSYEAFLEAHAYFAARHAQVGLLGQKLVSYEDPQHLQAIGARLGRRSLQARHIGCGELDHGQYDDYACADAMDYPVGASLFFSRTFLRDVGPMREDYFLYYEELDWVERSKKAGYRHGYMWKIPLRHREGGTIRSDAGVRKYSAVADYFSIVSRLRFAWWNRRRCLPGAMAYCLLILGHRALTGNWRSVWLVLKLRNPIRKPR